MSEAITPAASAEKAPTGKPLSFEERVAIRIADIVTDRILDAFFQASSAGKTLTLHQLPGCRLVGLRLSQFERFCAIMRENPAMKPYHAAQQVLKELAGRGGYSRASSLQRYAIMHKRFW